jgi:hypothetical protein
MAKQRWRVVGVRWWGWKYALITDLETGEQIGVYKRLGKWRLFKDDSPVRDSALRGCARRAFRQFENGGEHALERQRP